MGTAFEPCVKYKIDTIIQEWTLSIENNCEMDLTNYILLAIAYVMAIHFAFGIANQFNDWVQVTIFVLGGCLGWYLDSYITGFVVAVVAHLILSNNVEF